MESPAALVTGGSRGIGKETAIKLAEHGYDVAITCREKAKRAKETAAVVRNIGQRAAIYCGDMTDPNARLAIANQLYDWTDNLQAVVLNASGGLESERLKEDPNYAMRINHDAQIGMLDAMSPIMKRGSTLAFITSNWAHFYGQMDPMPGYEPIARSKHAGELAIRSCKHLAEAGIRLVVVSTCLIKDSITPRMLARQYKGYESESNDPNLCYVSSNEFSDGIVEAITDESIKSGETIVVGPFPVLNEKPHLSAAKR